MHRIAKRLLRQAPTMLASAIASTACGACHAAARDFDFICEQDHGCIELPVTGAQIALLQDSDPRCAR